MGNTVARFATQPTQMPITQWIQENEATFAWLVGFSTFTFFASLIAVPIIVARMPADYFMRERKRLKLIGPRLAGRLAKNAIGVVLILGGLAMLVLPGQGILTILIGLSLVTFPGKRALELRIIRIRSIHRTINWLRRKAKREPLQIPGKSQRPRAPSIVPTETDDSRDLGAKASSPDRSSR